MRQRASAGSAKPSLSMASMPPVSKKLLAKVARAVKSAGVPRLARNTLGRAPRAFSVASDLSRSASNGCGEPDRRQRVELDLRLAIRCAARPASPSAPPSGSRAGWETRWRRSARRGALRYWPRAPCAWPRPCSGTGPVEARRRRRRLSRSPGTAPRPPRRAARVSVSMPPAPAAGSLTLARLLSSSSTSLRVARHAPREGIRQPERQRVRQHGDRVGAGEPGRKRRHGRAQHVHVGIALRQHAPGGFGGDEQRLRRQARRPARRAPTAAAARGTLPWSGTGRHPRQAAHRPCLAPARARRRRASSARR